MWTGSTCCSVLRAESAASGAGPGPCSAPADAGRGQEEDGRRKDRVTSAATKERGRLSNKDLHVIGHDCQHPDVKLHALVLGQFWKNRALP